MCTYHMTSHFTPTHMSMQTLAHRGEQKVAREVEGTIYQRVGEFLPHHLHILREEETSWLSKAYVKKKMHVKSIRN